MRLICTSCSDRECVKVVKGRQPSSIEIQEMVCGFSPEQECEFVFDYDDMEDEIFSESDFMNETELNGRLYV